jgi:hypothetical protein
MVALLIAAVGLLVLWLLALALLARVILWIVVASFRVAWVSTLALLRLAR